MKKCRDCEANAEEVCYECGAPLCEKHRYTLQVGREWRTLCEGHYDEAVYIFFALTPHGYPEWGDD